MLLLDAQSKGTPINIINKAVHNEGQCLPDDGSSNDFDDIPSPHTHTHFLRHLCQKVSSACSSDCAETEHQVHLAWNVTECYRQPQTDALLSAMNCCSKSDIIYFWLTASNVYSK